MTAASRRPLIAGNWKMYKNVSETMDYLTELKRLLPDKPAVDITIAPPFTSLETAVKTAEGSPVAIAAQNVFWEADGAYTGEVSVDMLKSTGVRQVIIGHSERRQYFGETDESVNRRVKAAIHGGLEPIICVGETLEQREAGNTFPVVRAQLTGALDGIAASGTLIVAYEPVWAIGTGKTATPEMAQEVHAYIRELLSNIFNKDVANQIRILYGGSVKPENAASLMGQADLDGALVGGASLKAETFIKIINFG